MATFNKKDQEILMESLDEILEEGLWDRMQARGSQAMGAIRGAGQQLKGAAQQKLGQIGSEMLDGPKDNTMTRKGQQNIQSGKASGQNAKIDFLRKNIDKRISNFVAEIKNDIKKLGLDIGNIEMVSGINDALNTLKQSVNAPQPQQADTQPEPPPLPQEGPTAKEYADSAPSPRNKAAGKIKSSAPTRAKGKLNSNPLAKHIAPEQEERFY
jgi:hypothetical protein